MRKAVADAKIPTTLAEITYVPENYIQLNEKTALRAGYSSAVPGKFTPPTLYQKVASGAGNKAFVSGADISRDGIDGDRAVTDAGLVVVDKPGGSVPTEYYGVSGTNWENPPILDSPSETRWFSREARARSST